RRRTLLPVLRAAVLLMMVALVGACVPASAATGTRALLPAVPQRLDMARQPGRWPWSHPKPQGNRLRALAFADQIAYAVGDGGTLLKTTDGGATWTSQSINASPGVTP